MVNQAENENTSGVMATALDATPAYVVYQGTRRQTAEKYVQLLTGGAGTPMHFVAEVQGRWISLIGTIDEHWDELERLNRDQHANIFCLLQESNLQGRRQDDITGGRAVVGECDQGDALPSKVPPSFKVNSKSGDHQYFVRDPSVPSWPVADTTAMMRGAAYAMRTDPAIGSDSRILRMPGFDHKKDPAKPFRVTLTIPADGKVQKFKTLKATGFKPIAPDVWRTYTAWDRVNKYIQQVPGSAALPAHTDRNAWVTNGTARARAAAWAHYAQYCLCRRRELHSVLADSASAEPRVLLRTAITPAPYDPTVEPSEWADRRLWAVFVVACFNYGPPQATGSELPDNRESEAWRRSRGLIKVWVQLAHRHGLAVRRAQVSGTDAPTFNAFDLGTVSESDVVELEQQDSRLGKLEPTRGNLLTFRLSQFITENNLASGLVESQRVYANCPFGADNHPHDTGGAAFFAAHGNKGPEFHCFHASCEGLRFGDVVRHYGPDVISAYCSSQLTDAECEQAANKDKGLTRLADTCPGSPDDDLLVQLPWAVEPDGVWRQKATGDRVRVTHAPIIITALARSLDNSAEEHVTLSWRRGNAWASKTIPRGQMCDARALIGMSAFGCPVNSENGKEVVAFLTALEAANLDRLPTERLTSHMGWQADDTFLLGDVQISRDGVASCIDGGAAARCVAEAGGRSVGAEFCRSGTFEEWVSLMTAVAHYPRVLGGLYAALSAVLLRIFGQPGFVFEWAGETSSGKTTALRVAASAFGKNTPSQQETLVRSWNITHVGLERTCAVQPDLPLFLDESQQWSGRPEALAGAVYMLANGTGRVRGTKAGGTQEVAQWRIVTLSTGEKQLGAFAPGSGGDKARVLSLTQQPFGPPSAETRHLVSRINRTLDNQYGTPAFMFVQWVAEHRRDWPLWRERHAAEAERLAALYPDNRVAGRLASAFAAIVVTADLIHEFLSLPWDHRPALESVWADIAAGLTDADRPLAALAFLYQHAVSHERQFHRAGIDDPVPHQGWLGTIDTDGTVWFIREQALKLLNAEGYPGKATLQSLAARELMDIGSDGSGKAKRVHGKSVRCVSIPPSAIALVVGEEPEEPRANRLPLDLRLLGRRREHG